MDRRHTGTTRKETDARLLTVKVDQPPVFLNVRGGGKPGKEDWKVAADIYNSNRPMEHMNQQ